MTRIAILALALTVPIHAYSQENHQHQHPTSSGERMPSQPGQAAFAAVQEIVEILQADPKTDWRKVSIEVLRQHLIDMDNVTLHATVKNEQIDGGIKFIVSGDGPVIGSIQRMVTAHAATMDGVDGWHFVASTTNAGAILTVMAPPEDIDMLHGLGFLGIMARGMHHQQHHLMLASGGNPHQ